MATPTTVTPKHASQDISTMENQIPDNVDIQDKNSTVVEDGPPTKTHYPLKFWLVFAGLCATGLISALDGSIVSTSLPKIIDDLEGGENYVWVVNVYFLTSAAVQPLYGQLANLWGRRYLMITVTAIFLLGSGLCGGANSMNMLIGARAVQGLGAGGINMLIDMIICDLVPMRERGNFIGLLFLIIAVGSSLGPFVGGVLTENASWRWVFYINLPFGGFALLLLVLFLQVTSRKEGTTRDKLKSIDWIGNAILIGATIAILWALTYGGTLYSWSAPNVLAPLVIGLVGLVIFFLFEMSSWCPYPVMPPDHFKNRTTCVGFFLSFMNMLLAFWIIYFYPVYFQSVLGASVARSGVNLIPEVIAFPVFAAVGGSVISKTGRYKPLHLFATGLLTLMMGLSSILDSNTHTAVWAVYLVFLGTGLGVLISTTLQTVQAGLPESETASSTGTWSFIRSLGTIWGVAIPGAVFNNRFDQLSYRIDLSVRDSFSHGKAYQHASAGLVNSFPPAIRAEVISVYVDTLKRVWQIGVVFAGVTFLAVFLEKEITLRKELDTDFGLATENKKEGESGQVNGANGLDTEIGLSGESIEHNSEKETGKGAGNSSSSSY